MGFKPGDHGFKAGDHGFKAGDHGIMADTKLMDAAKTIAAFIAEHEAMADLVTVIAAQVYEIRQGTAEAESGE